MSFSKQFPLTHFALAGSAGVIMIYLGVKQKSYNKNLRYALIGLGSLAIIHGGYALIQNKLSEGKIARTLSEIENEVEHKFAIAQQAE